MTAAGRYPQLFLEVNAGPASNAPLHRRYDSAEAVARAMRLESVRRLASLEACVRQLSLFNQTPDACVLEEIAALKAGIALLDEQSEPVTKELP